MRHKKLRCFIISMVATLCATALFFGLLTVDYNSRWVAFGNDHPIACVITTQNGKRQIEVNVMGEEKAIDITPGYQVVQWTEQGAKWFADVWSSVFADICKVFANLQK